MAQTASKAVDQLDLLPMKAPVLDALAAFQAMSDQAHDAGMESTTVKQWRATMLDDMHGLERRQQTSSHEPAIVELEQQLERLREAYATSSSRLQELQQTRIQYENQAMHLRDVYMELAHRAKAAYLEWRKAQHVMASDPSAYARYKAKIDRTVAQQALERLVGVDDVQAVLYQGETRPWLQD